MRKRTLLIILFILVAVGCASPKISEIKSSISIGGEEVIRRVHDPKTGSIISSKYLDKRTKEFVPGIKAIGWICAKNMTVKEDLKTNRDCREIRHTLAFHGRTQKNPDYDCGGYGCDFWP
jgi:hypothetical protein